MSVEGPDWPWGEPITVTQEVREYARALYFVSLRNVVAAMTGVVVLSTVFLLSAHADPDFPLWSPPIGVMFGLAIGALVAFFSFAFTMRRNTDVAFPERLIRREERRRRFRR